MIPDHRQSLFQRLFFRRKGNWDLQAIQNKPPQQIIIPTQINGRRFAPKVATKCGQPLITIRPANDSNGILMAANRLGHHNISAQRVLDGSET